MNQSLSSEELSYQTEIHVDSLQNQLLMMMMFGWIEIQAIADEVRTPWWESNFIWGLTRHSYEHGQSEPTKG